MSTLYVLLSICLVLQVVDEHPGTQNDTERTCQEIYPKMDRLVNGPEIWFADSVIGPNSRRDDIQVGFHYRLITVHCEYYKRIVLEKVTMHGEEGIHRIVAYSFFVHDIELPAYFDRDAGNVTWVSPSTVKIELADELCYQFELGERPEDLKIVKCK